MADWDVVPRVAAATAQRAEELGLARVSHSREEYIAGATQRIAESRRMLNVLMREGIVAERPSLLEPAGQIPHQFA